MVVELDNYFIPAWRFPVGGLYIFANILAPLLGLSIRIQSCSKFTEISLISVSTVVKLARSFLT